MKNKEYYSIIKMIENIEKAIKYTEEITFDEFSKNTMVIDATVFVISQIGELVKNIGKECQLKYPNIKWHILKGIRNRIIHDYEGINLELIWSIVKKDIIQLKYDLQEIIKDK